MTLSQAIQQYRKEKGYCQEYMANQLNVSQSTYSRLEKSDAACTKRLMAIANVLGTEPDTLLTYPGSDTQDLISATTPPKPRLEIRLLDKDKVIGIRRKKLRFSANKSATYRQFGMSIAGGGQKSDL